MHSDGDDRAPTWAAAALGLATALHGWTSAMIVSVQASIADAFPTGAAGGWLTTGFFLAAAAAAPVAGRLADIAGATKVAAVGLVLIAATSAVAAAANELDWIIAARAGCGIGTAMQYPAALAALRQSGLTRSGPALTSIVLASEVAFTSAPSAATLIAHAWGWRAVLASPIVLAVAALALLPTVGAAHAPRVRVREIWRELDVPGLAAAAAAVVVALALLLAAPVRVRWPLLAVVALLAGLAWWWERRGAERPFLPRGLLTRGPIAVTLLRHAAFYISFYLLFYALPPALADRGLSPRQVAAVMAALAVITIGTRIVAPRIEARTARRALLVGGTALAAAGAAVAGGALTGPLGVCVAIVALLGVPNALCIAANQACLFEASPHTAGMASGLYRSVQFIAGGLAGAVIALATSGPGLIAVAGASVIAAVVLLAASTARTGIAAGSTTPSERSTTHDPRPHATQA